MKFIDCKIECVLPRRGEQGIQGVRGERGKSAFEAAVEGGFTGTEEEFNELLAEVIKLIMKKKRRKL